MCRCCPCILRSLTFLQNWGTRTCCTSWWRCTQRHQRSAIFFRGCAYHESPWPPRLATRRSSSRPYPLAPWTRHSTTPGPWPLSQHVLQAWCWLPAENFEPKTTFIYFHNFVYDWPIAETTFYNFTDFLKGLIQGTASAQHHWDFHVGRGSFNGSQSWSAWCSEVTSCFLRLLDVHVLYGNPLYPNISKYECRMYCLSHYFVSLVTAAALRCMMSCIMVLLLLGIISVCCTQPSSVLHFLIESSENWKCRGSLTLWISFPS